MSSHFYWFFKFLLENLTLFRTQRRCYYVNSRQTVNSTKITREMHKNYMYKQNIAIAGVINLSKIHYLHNWASK